MPNLPREPQTGQTARLINSHLITSRGSKFTVHSSRFTVRSSRSEAVLDPRSLLLSSQSAQWFFAQDIITGRHADDSDERHRDERADCSEARRGAPWDVEDVARDAPRERDGGRGAHGAGQQPEAAVFQRE